MKLYVWKNFCPDYSDGLAFAIANSMQEAMDMVEQQMNIRVYDWGTVEEFDLTNDTPIGFGVTGGM